MLTAVFACRLSVLSSASYKIPSSLSSAPLDASWDWLKIPCEAGCEAVPLELVVEVFELVLEALELLEALEMLTGVAGASR